MLEFAAMKTGAFPEPLTFSLRALRLLRARRADFDLVHDNQVLAYGLLGLPRIGLPLVTSIHHPISVDRRIELAAAHGKEWLGKWRWYSFVRMQGRVARRVGPILTASQASRADICRDFRVGPEQVHVIPLGVDTRLFHPRPAPRVPGRIVAVASADSPLKGVGTLLAAVAKLTVERDAQLTVVGKPATGGPTERLVGELALGDRVRFVHGISDTELAELCASAEIAVVPSLYEGFSLPAVEHMASGTPLVASRTGALPEVTGDAARLVEPGNPDELAAALRDLLDSPAQRDQLGAAAWQRVQERFAWSAVARATVRPLPAPRSRRTEPGHADRGLPAAPGRPGRPGARPRLRRRAARLRGAAPRRHRGGAGRGRGRAARGGRDGRGHAAAGRDAGQRGHQHGMRRRDRDAVPGRRVRPGDRGRGARAHPGRPAALAEITRVLRPGGQLAVTVPAWLPERICWGLSADYHNTPGGHVRIYTRAEMEAKLTAAGLRVGGHHHAHGLHSPYWWLKCAVGVHDDGHPLARAYHRLLVWDIMKRPAVTRLAEQAMNPLIGKSLVIYAEKPAAPQPARPVPATERAHAAA